MTVIALRDCPKNPWDHPRPTEVGPLHIGINKQSRGAILQYVPNGLQDVTTVGRFQGRSRILLYQHNGYPGCIDFSQGL
jgi:hypothetical protein